LPWKHTERLVPRLHPKEFNLSHIHLNLHEIKLPQDGQWDGNGAVI